jgi:hypothetical protein
VGGTVTGPDAGQSIASKGSCAASDARACCDPTPSIGAAYVLRLPSPLRCETPTFARPSRCAFAQQDQFSVRMLASDRVILMTGHGAAHPQRLMTKLVARPEHAL